MTATASLPSLPSQGWGAAAMLFTFGAYALGYLARYRHVETAAEARERRLNDREEKALKRLCKRHRSLVDALIAHDGTALDIPLPGLTLHLRDDEGRFR